MTVTLPCPTSARWSDPEPTGLPVRCAPVTMPDRLDRGRWPVGFWVSTGLWKPSDRRGGTAPRVEIIESSGVFDEGCRPSTPRPAGPRGVTTGRRPNAPSGSGVVLSGSGGAVVHITINTSRSPPRGAGLRGADVRARRPHRPFLHDPAASLPATFDHPGTTRKDPEGPDHVHSRLSATVRVAPWPHRRVRRRPAARSCRVTGLPSGGGGDRTAGG